MRPDLILKISLVISLTLAVIAFYTYFTGAESTVYLVIFTIAALVFLAIAIPEIMRSPNLNRTEKMMWVIALIFFFTLSAIVYFLLGRNRVISENNSSPRD